jgi:hypothetical protein
MKRASSSNHRGKARPAARTNGRLQTRSAQSPRPATKQFGTQTHSAAVVGLDRSSPSPWPSPQGRGNGPRHAALPPRRQAHAAHSTPLPLPEGEGWGEGELKADSPQRTDDSWNRPAPASRQFELPLAELVDRLTVDQVKEVLLAAGRASYAEEMRALEHDIDLIAANKNLRFDARTLRVVIALAQLNLHIWHNKDRMAAAKSEAQYLQLLKFAHQLNGIRNRLKNHLLEVAGDQSPAARRSNTETDDLAGWNLSVLQPLPLNLPAGAPVSKPAFGERLHRKAGLETGAPPSQLKSARREKVRGIHPSLP